MDLKTSLAWLFVIVVVVVIGLSSARFEKPDRLGTDPPGWAERLGDLVLTKRALEPADLAQPPLACPVLFAAPSFTLDAGQGCRYDVVPDDAFRKSTRLLTLRASGTARVDVRFDPEDERLLSERYVLGGQQTVEISHGGGALSVSCAGPGSCSIAVVAR